MNLDTPAGRACIEAAAAAECVDPAEDEFTFREWCAFMRAPLTAALAARVPCPTCGGNGHYLGHDSPPFRPIFSCCLGCHVCGGEGTVSALRLLMDGEEA